MFSRAMHKPRTYFNPSTTIIGRQFSELGHEVVLLKTALTDGTGGVLNQDGIDVHHLPGTAEASSSSQIRTIFGATFDRLHAERQFDLIVGRGAATWAFHNHSQFAGQVPVLSHEGTYPTWLHQLDRRLPALSAYLSPPLALAFLGHKRIYRACLQRADLVISNSPALATAFQRVYWWNPPKTGFIAYGFNPAPFLSVGSQRPAAGPPRIVFVGRLTWDKGVIGMIDILAQMKRRDAVIEAIGPMSDKVRKEIRSHAAARGVGDRFLTPGPADNTSLPHRLLGATAYVFASTHPEGLSKSVMEAMAAALPVVAYQMPGMDTLIESGVTGWIVPTRDTAQAAAKLDNLLSNPAAAASMGQAARARLERDFSPGVVSAQWESTLHDVVAGFRQRKLSSAGTG